MTLFFSTGEKGVTKDNFNDRPLEKKRSYAWVLKKGARTIDWNGERSFKKPVTQRLWQCARLASDNLLT